MYLGIEVTSYKCLIQFLMMLKLLLRAIAKELLATQGHAPFLLGQLTNLRPRAKQIVTRYLRWRIGRMSYLDIQLMIDLGQVSTEDLDLFIEELS